MKAVLTGGEPAAPGTESIRLRGERGDLGFLISRGFPLQADPNGERSVLVPSLKNGLLCDNAPDPLSVLTGRGVRRYPSVRGPVRG